MEDKQKDRSGRLPVTIEDGVTLEQLISRVQSARGKPMEIHELPELANETGALCGLWLDTAEKDIVIHAPSSSTLHRQQFLLHELAHMILLHDRDDNVFTPRGLLPGISAGTVVKALARDRINDDLELAAEALADELAAAMRRRSHSRFSEVFG